MKANEQVNPARAHREGSAKVAAALGIVSFPTDKPTLESKVGSWKIPLGDGHVATLRDILEAVPQDHFQDHGAAMNAIDVHWRDAVHRIAPKPAPAPKPEKKAAAPEAEESSANAAEAGDLEEEEPTPAKASESPAP